MVGDGTKVAPGGEWGGGGCDAGPNPLDVGRPSRPVLLLFLSLLLLSLLLKATVEKLSSKLGDTHA